MSPEGETGLPVDRAARGLRCALTGDTGGRSRTVTPAGLATPGGPGVPLSPVPSFVGRSAGPVPTTASRGAVGRASHLRGLHAGRRLHDTHVCARGFAEARSRGQSLPLRSQGLTIASQEMGAQKGRRTVTVPARHHAVDALRRRDVPVRSRCGHGDGRAVSPDQPAPDRTSPAPTPGHPRNASGNAASNQAGGAPVPQRRSTPSPPGGRHPARAFGSRAGLRHWRPSTARFIAAQSRPRRL